MVVVEARDDMVVRRAVKDLPYLLQEAFSVELRRADKGILAQENVLAAKGRVKAEEGEEILLVFIKLIGQRLCWRAPPASV